MADDEDEHALKWAAIERLSTFDRMKKGLIKKLTKEGKVVHEEVDVTKLGVQERKHVIDNVLKVFEEDNESFLRRLRERTDRVGVEIPKIEVRFENLSIEGDAYVGTRALPTLLNTTLNAIEDVLGLVKLFPSKKRTIKILKDVSGIVRPSRLTLLLGPPSSGKTTLLKALSGKLDTNLRVTGKVTYCGHEFSEFVPQRTCAYISQHDLHYGEMTVHETLDFSGRCLGVGSRYETLIETLRREKNEGVQPDSDVDVFMKATALAGHNTSLITDYVLKILGLEICADILVGDDMRRGEMLVGPARAFFMDEISTGLDSSTTFQIINYMRQIVHIMDVTMIISLLQPAPETFELFDDIILLSNGQIVCQGPRDNVLEFFEQMGFKCPERKAVADFLQELTSIKDQEQYWCRNNQPYRYISVPEFSQAFNSFHIGQSLCEELRVPYDKTKVHSSTLVREKYGISNWELFKACFSREWLLMKRNSFVYIFKTFQITVMAVIAFTVFFRTQMKSGKLEDGTRFWGALFFSLINVMFNGMVELAMTVFRLPVFYKQRDSLFYPAWAFALPIWILRIPISLMEAGIWIVLTYYTIGFAPAASRWNTTICTCKSSQPTVGKTLLKERGLFVDENWYWIGIGALLGFSLLFNVLFIAALTFLKAFGDSKPVVTDEDFENHTKKSISKGSKNAEENVVNKKIVLALPFQPLTLAFDHVNYYVDMPVEMKKKSRGVRETRLLLLRDVSGAFRPGVLTALIGVSGAGKTTLMDVLAGRKTGGYIEGSISISGYPKNQATFARVCGYCEQNDIHSPYVTVHESLIYSALLRLGSDVKKETRKAKVMELIELNSLRNALVGLPGVNGLTTEQRKRLTIAVELVANPSIIFMDEPTSGLDARAAAIVMRTVRNTVDTGRTVVCTIHQPSIDIFEAFDELLLMKTGGQVIYAGPLGHHSQDLVEYFEAISGVPKIREGYNPATWVLEVSSNVVETQLGIDFANVYVNSNLYQRNEELIKQLSTPQEGSKDLNFPTKYSQSFMTQCKACFWKQHWSYWRNSHFNAIREKQQDLINLLGATYSAVLFLGATNTSAVQSVVAIERTVFYRERAAGMYSELPYAFAQLIPIWWRWYYWCSPVAWTIYGIFTSQIGDKKTLIEISGEKPKAVDEFLKELLGFEYDFLIYVIFAHLGWVLLFFFVFAYGIKFLNFQKR
ncbi:hypothetical protein G4B88_018977 [Cannabis sativa]|uniref:ABC transporter domain-containing protein n=2 Tax=Cannabis sativa TaxID=3483 RepID=A0A7J6H229_CANSA|nr:hypothetical protein G4B88_018977 [Cannabis sativa]